LSGQISTHFQLKTKTQDEFVNLNQKFAFRDWIYTKFFCFQKNINSCSHDLCWI